MSVVTFNYERHNSTAYTMMIPVWPHIQLFCQQYDSEFWKTFVLEMCNPS